MTHTPDRSASRAPRPIRTCIGCRTAVPVTGLTRCRLAVDGRARCERGADALAGRGAWICARSLACFDLAVRRGAFSRAWRRPVSAEALAELRNAFGSPDAHMRESRVAGMSGVAEPEKG